MSDRYLLFCTTGLGDSIFCTPAIRFLRRQQPECAITVVVKNKQRNLFETNLHLNGLVSYRNNGWSQWLARRRIQRGGPYRAIFFFHVGDEVLGLIKTTQYGRLHCVQKLKNLPRQAQVFPIDTVHRRQWEDFADMVALECGGQNQDHEFEIPVLPESRRAAEEYYAQHASGAGPKIGLQLGGSHLGKCWPPDRYASVAALLLGRYGGVVFVNATRKERPLWEQFLAALPADQRSRSHLLPQTSINHHAALVARLDLLITNDTGPLHVALSQNRPVVALKAHDDHTYPYTLPRPTPLRRSLFVRTDVQTSGKVYQQSHRAMECISIESVQAEAEAILKELGFQPKP